MKPWRLVLEVGMSGEVETPKTQVGKSSPPLDQEAAWKLLVDARKNLLVAMEGSDAAIIDTINNWMGGAVALLAAITNESPAGIQERLALEIPSPPPVSTTNIRFAEVERKRPDPPPGAPRVVDPSEFTDEERERLGIIDPHEESSPGQE